VSLDHAGDAGSRTRDLGGSASIEQVTEALVAALRERSSR
jgi:isocitrate/isopropylmalate dehydrogenase